MPRLKVRDFGTCLRFNGSSAFVAIPSAAPLEIAGDRSVTCWVRMAKPPTAGGFVYFFRKVTGSHISWGVYQQTLHGSIRAEIYDGTHDPDVGSDINRTDGRWHFAALCIKAGQTVKLYVDGVLDASAADTTVGSLAGNAAIIIGNPNFSGEIDEPRVFASELTQAQVQDLYYNGVVDRSVLRGEWLFNEGAGAVVLDSSGNGNDGAITDAVYSSNVPMRSRFPASLAHPEAVLSGNEITDLTRALAVSGDGLPADDGSTGIWQAGTNLFPNGGFEVDTSAWGIYPGTNTGLTVSLARVTAQHKFGEASAKFDVAWDGSGVPADQCLMYGDLETAAQGQTWSASVWVYIPTLTAGMVFWLDLETSGAAGSYPQSVNITAVNGSFVRLTVTYPNLPVGTTGIRPRLVFYNPNGGAHHGIAYVDGIQLEQLAIPTPYVTKPTNLQPNPNADADLAGWGGAGTAVLTRETGANTKFNGTGFKATNAAGGDGYPQGPGAATLNGHTYTGGYWVMSPTGGTVRIKHSNFIDQDLYDVSAVLVAGVWKRVSGSGTVASASLSFLPFISLSTDDPFYFGGITFVESPVDVDYDALATRAAARVQVPVAGIITPSRGTVVVRWEQDIPPETYYESLFSWTNTGVAAFVEMLLSITSGVLFVQRLVGGTGGQIATARPSQGAPHTGIFVWTPTTILTQLDTNGPALAADTSINPPGVLPTTFELGSRANGTLYLNGRVRWAAFFSGTVDRADPVLHADATPNLLDLIRNNGGLAVPTAIFDGATQRLISNVGSRVLV
jgi:hypothetical protein